MGSAATATAVDGTGTGPLTGDGDPLPASVLTGKGIDDAGTPLEGTSDNDSTESLREMAGALKKIDDQCRAALIPDPTAAEQNIYMLMLNHLSSEIFLFNREKYADAIESVVEELRRMPGINVDEEHGDPRDSMNPVGDMSMISVEEKGVPDYLLSHSDTYDKMNCLGDDVLMLITLMEKLRQSIPTPKCLSAEFQSSVMEISVGKWDAAKEEMKESPDSNTASETREKMLGNFLHELSQRRIHRSYAPPAEEEIKWYRKIRKLVTSIVTFLAAKEDWLFFCSLLEPKEHNEIVSESEAERVNKCGADGGGEYKTSPFFIYDVQFLAPYGHKTALVFDRLPEIRQLLSESKQRFSNICLRSFVKDGVMHVSTSPEDVTGRKRAEDVIGETGGRKGAEVCQEREVKKKRKHDLGDVYETEASDRFCLPSARNHDKQRCLYLTDILRNLAWMQESALSQSLSNTEVRLYARILEHVNSSIWLFESRASPEEKKKHISDMRHQGPKGDDNDAEYTTKDPVVMKLDTCGYLAAMMQLVHTIESVFPVSVPNVEEMSLYVKIRDQMSMDRLEPRCCQGQESERYMSGAAGPQGNLALAKSVLKATWAKEIEIAHEMGKEFEDMLGKIFAKAAQGSNVKEWFMKNPKEAKVELWEMVKGGQEEKILDNLLISLHEVEILSTHIILAFNEANVRVSNASDSFKQLKVPLMEGWVALRVEEGTSSNSD